MNKTCFTVAGEGATVRELLDRLMKDPVAAVRVYQVDGGRYDLAWERLLELKDEEQLRTNIVLLAGIGDILTLEDLERLARAEVKRV